MPFVFTFLTAAGLLIWCLGAHEAWLTPRSAAPGFSADAAVLPARAQSASLRNFPEHSGTRRWERMRRSPPAVDRKIFAADPARPEPIEKNLLVKHVPADIGESPVQVRRRIHLPARSGTQKSRAPALAARQRAAGPAGESAIRGAFIQFDGPADWSVIDFVEIERFYLRRFGRPPPVSAMGQSGTHDRLGLDHRDAVDIAVRPDSSEGRALIAYLRRAGIPFIAFRGRSAGVSTGAHIHIGRPSPRLIEARQRVIPARHEGTTES